MVSCFRGERVPNGSELQGGACEHYSAQRDRAVSTRVARASTCGRVSSADGEADELDYSSVFSLGRVRVLSRARRASVAVVPEQVFAGMGKCIHL